MDKIKICYLEILVNRTCNLKCIGCTSFCDYPQVESSDWNKVKQDIIEWDQILEIKNIGLLGGEPLANSKFYEWLIGVRNILKDSFILVISNGILLDKWPDIIEMMIQNCPGQLMITLHKDNDRIISILDKMISESGYRFIVNRKYEEYLRIEYTLLDTKKKFSIVIYEPDYFLKSYSGYGRNIYPYNTTNYEESFDICIGNPILHNGRLYRCSKLALLKSQLELTGQLYDRKEIKPWEPYLDYEGIRYTDDLEKIRLSLEKFYIAEEYCKLCPGRSDDCKIMNEQNSLTLSYMIRNDKELFESNS